MSRVVSVLKTAEGGLWLVPQIEEMRRRGHEVVVVLPSGGGRLRRRLDERGVVVREIDWNFSFRPGWRLLRSLWNLRRMILGDSPDVVFSHLYASTLAVRFSTLGAGVRRVMMVAGPLYLENPWIRRAERLLCRLDTTVIAGSAYSAGLYRDLGRRRGVVTIPYGVDTDHFRRGEDPRAELLGVSRDTFVVVLVAYVYPPRSSVHRGVGIKGHETLLAAWRQFTAVAPDAALIVVGGGWQAAGEEHRDLLVEQSAEMPSVRWVRTVTDVRPYYSAADLSVSPSLSENHGAALEASSMSVPSLVSDAGALPETVQDGVSGWIVPAGDVDALSEGLARAYQQHLAGGLVSMGRAARELVEREFSQQSSSASVAQVVLDERS